MAPSRKDLPGGKEKARGRPRRLLLLFFYSASAIVACGPAHEPASRERPRREDLPPVRTVRARVRTIQPRIVLPASVVARRRSRIGAEVSGTIRKVRVWEGDPVEAGDVLFEIDPEPYRLAVEQAQAALDLARAERAQREADLRRAEELRKKGVLPPQELESLSTALAVSRARERQAAVALEAARDKLERTVVRAPYAGTVTGRFADEGTTALVQPQTIVVEIQETSELVALADVPEKHAGEIRPGDRVLVFLERRAEPVETAISRVNPAVDEASRTFRVRAPLPPGTEGAAAGSFARVEIFPRARPRSVLVPRESVRSRDGTPHVLVVREGKVEAVPVQLGMFSGDEVEIVRGIDPGTEVLAGEEARTIAEGMAVRALPEKGEKEP
ncbi:MAG: MexE family multidrug efflux RND transporter periplasmic adaptor subunit [Candidatus Binatia bacterium]|nr:MAG: MexE family multidrug efflux RND transporter periplasmic adaptor subunit [Candidatus Binatia bacterium]